MDLRPPPPIPCPYPILNKKRFGCAADPSPPFFDNVQNFVFFLWFPLTLKFGQKSDILLLLFCWSMFFCISCRSFCCYCYYLKFSQNWISSTCDLFVIVVVFILLLFLLLLSKMMMMLLFFMLFYPRNLPSKVWSKLGQ